MTFIQKYVDYILENVIQGSIRVQLYRPFKDGSRMITKIGPTVHCQVKIEVLEKYTRSAKLKLTFDKYEIEELFFIPFSSNPESIEGKTRTKIEKIVNQTFIDDNRTEDIKQMYEQQHKLLGEALSKIVGKKKDN